MPPLINPRTGNPLNRISASIISEMAGAGSISAYEQEWPLFGCRFGSPSEVKDGLNALERDGLIERTPGRPFDEKSAHGRHYRITDAARQLLAPAKARWAAHEAALEAERKQAQAERDREEAARKAENDRVARIVEAYPVLLEALRQMAVDFIDDADRINLVIDTLNSIGEQL